MSKLVRFGVSLDSGLLKKFDDRVKEEKYPTRSKAIADLIRASLFRKECREGKEVVGVITLVYDHHKKDLVNKLMEIQHDYGEIIISTQHIHLDHNNCLEIVITRGRPGDIIKLSDMLKALKGVKSGEVGMATTGKEI